MLFAWKIYAKFRRHLADFHTKFAKIKFFSHQNVVILVKLICNIKKLYLIYAYLTFPEGINQLYRLTSCINTTMYPKASALINIKLVESSFLKIR